MLSVGVSKEQKEDVRDMLILTGYKPSRKGLLEYMKDNHIVGPAVLTESLANRILLKDSYEDITPKNNEE